MIHSRRAGHRTSRAGATSCTSRPRRGASATRRTPRSVREAFLTGSSPSDFPEEHYEREWPDRFTVDQLNETGRRGLGLD